LEREFALAIAADAHNRAGVLKVGQAARSSDGEADFHVGALFRLKLAVPENYLA
jgi:hypothetical protein